MVQDDYNWCDNDVHIIIGIDYNRKLYSRLSTKLILTQL